MQVRPVGVNVVDYYLRQGEGRWAGSGRADLGLDGPVGRADLQAALRGCDPASGRLLGQSRTARRRPGWDVGFAAPKSLSLLAAQPGPLGRRVAAAQRAAVGEALSHFEASLLHLRRSSSPDGKVPASGAVAAEFDHFKNAGGEPHLHSHLLLLNLGRDSRGCWSSLGPWWLGRRELDAVYALGLRHHLTALGIGVEWRVRPDGLIDVAGVPRAAVRAASTRTHESMTGSRHTGRTSDPNRPWRERIRAHGWDPAAARVGRSNESGDARRVRDTDLDNILAARLALRASAFGRRDVLLELGGCPDARFTSAGARRWVDEFLSKCEKTGVIPDQGGASHPARWTSELSRLADDRLEESLRKLILDGSRVAVLGGAARQSRFLWHAAVAAEYAHLGASEGVRVAVSARSPVDALRWKTLTGIDELRPGSRADVVFVDQADRRSSAELSVVLGTAKGATVVLVEGGTSLRRSRPASLALERLSGELPRIGGNVEVAWDVGGADPAHPAVRALTCWAEMRTDSPTMLVALGVPETQALNDAARRHLARLDELRGPELVVRGRGFRAGDTVIAVRPLGAGLPSGTVGAVAEVNLAAGTAVVEWPRRGCTMDRAALARVGHGYAATPRLASRTDLPALVLGPAEAIGLERGRVLETFSADRADGRALGRDVAGRYGPDTWPVHWQPSHHLQ